MNESLDPSKILTPLSPCNDSGPEPTLTANPVSVWLRRFLACNPFYLVSAALLLYGCYRVSTDPHFLSREIAQLCFNLSSLQVYEALLVVTAIFLAKRAIWYDSTLLVGLENMLVLVPFILISQAALIDPRIVWTLSLCGGLLAVVRFGGLRRFIRRLNFPRRVQIIALAVLAVNVALPIVYRVLHESKFGTRLDSGGAYQMNQYAWWVVLPFICALAAVLPAVHRKGDLLPEHHLLPLGCFSLWLAGTVVHLYCLGYIYDFTLRADLVAPAAWMLAWVCHLKALDLFPALAPCWRRALLALPFPVTLLAASTQHKEVFVVLTAANVGIYAAIGLIKRNEKLPMHLGLISLVALLGGLPADWYQSLGTEFTRARFLGGGAAAYCLLWAALSRDARLGIVGAVVCAATLIVFGKGSDAAMHWAIQGALAFLLMHSLRWMDGKQDGAPALRLLAALVWVVHAFVWMRLGGAGWMVCVVAGPVLAVYFAARLVAGDWGPKVVPLASLVVLLSGPGDFTAGQVQSAPAGFVAIIGSFLLFGVGTLAAITKRHWNKTAR